jgi:hypothetical protein
LGTDVLLSGQSTVPVDGQGGEDEREAGDPSVIAALDERIGRALAVAAYLLREGRIRGRSTAGRTSDLGWS